MAEEGDGSQYGGYYRNNWPTQYSEVIPYDFSEQPDFQNDGWGNIVLPNVNVNDFNEAMTRFGRVSAPDHDAAVQAEQDPAGNRHDPFYEEESNTADLFGQVPASHRVRSQNRTSRSNLPQSGQFAGSMPSRPDENGGFVLGQSSGSMPSRTDENGVSIFEFKDFTQRYHPDIGYYFKAPNPAWDPTGEVGRMMDETPSQPAPPPAQRASKKRKLSASMPQAPSKAKKTSKKPQKRGSGPAFQCSCRNLYTQKVKRPVNAFIAWKSHIDSTLRKMHPTASNGELSKIAGDIWKRMTDQEKEPWWAKQRENAEEHKQQNPGYKYDQYAEAKKKAGVKGVCQCGAVEKNESYESLRKAGWEKKDAVEEVQRQFGNTLMGGALGLNRPSAPTQQYAAEQDVFAQHGSYYIEGEEADIARRLS